MRCFVMTRSFAEHFGFKWPKDIACIVNGERITYAQLKAEKIRRQKERLDSIMADVNPGRRAAYIWVYYQPGLFGFAYQGYWLSIRTLEHTWTFGYRSLDVGGIGIVDVMGMFPCGYLPMLENFELWKRAFVKRYWNPGRFKVQGMVMGWVYSDGGWPKSFEQIELAGRNG